MSPRTAHRWRWLSVVILLAAAAAFLHSRSYPENLPARKTLDDFPRTMEDWQGRDIVIDPQVLEVLGADDVLTRLYTRQLNEPPVNLYMAFFESQRTGATIHSPQNCLPGAGWAPLESGFRQFSGPRGEVTVNRYVIAKGLDRQLVFYWYLSHGRVVASEYWAKFYLVADAIRLNRTDAALVRVSTPVGRMENVAGAERRAASFAEAVLPLLEAYIPE